MLDKEEIMVGAQYSRVQSHGLSFSLSNITESARGGLTRLFSLSDMTEITRSGLTRLFSLINITARHHATWLAHGDLCYGSGSNAGIVEKAALSH